VGRRVGREGECGLEVADDLGDLPAIPTADSVDLFDQTPVLFHEPRVQRVALLHALEVLHRHADVQVVGARGQNVLSGRRRLGGDGRFEVGIEEHRAQPLEKAVERLPGARRDARATPRGGVRGRGEAIGTA
jgi:hypothetical protein